MDLGNIVYIVAILAYFIYQATRGKKKNQEDDIPESSQTPEEKPVSFEDLLREIRGAQKSKSPETVAEIRESVPVNRTKPEDYRLPSAPKEKSEWRADPAPAVKRFPIKKLQEADDEIEYYQGAFEKSKSDLTTTSKGIPEIPSLREIQSESSTYERSRYSRMLKNPQSIKDAIVFKEILDRKHF